jgi:excisionase family DNA binding protein
MSKKNTNEQSYVRIARGRRAQTETENKTTATSTAAKVDDVENVLVGGDEMLRIKQVAKAIGVQPSTAYDYVRAGLIKSVKLHDGPRAPIRIRRADLEQYIADRRANQTRDAVAAEKRRRAAR